MKLSISLSEGVARRLSASAKRLANGNASLLTDVALKRLLDLPDEEVAALIARWHMDRKAATREGWMQAFWLVLGQRLGRQDTIDNPYAPRNYGPFYVVLLLNHAGRYDDETDPFIPFAGPRIVSVDAPPTVQWNFDRSQSPTKAAEIVATKLQELGATADA
jgi:hypothetical protein